MTPSDVVACSVVAVSEAMSSASSVTAPTPAPSAVSSLDVTAASAEARTTLVAMVASTARLMPVPNSEEPLETPLLSLTAVSVAFSLARTAMFPASAVTLAETMVAEAPPWMSLRTTAPPTSNE